MKSEADVLFELAKDLQETAAAVAPEFLDAKSVQEVDAQCYAEARAVYQAWRDKVALERLEDDFVEWTRETFGWGPPPGPWADGYGACYE